MDIPKLPVTLQWHHITVNHGFQISHAPKKNANDKHSVVSLWQGGTKSCAYDFLLTLFQSHTIKPWIESLGARLPSCSQESFLP